ncbi:helix-turn-helix domain-containing protein [Duganella sp. FT135W]|uniref:Helix-turn-helix domain-containing protein n=1 Tax=Duganella flavida TaxID=2692175 RepID=A0A6L8KJY6_9BURK|nr:helix-turn-helix transcriptional regulator [Duganella flavida]MYM26498.1 helix-turn-helix domain-containing protein [Duganella flavida]
MRHDQTFNSLAVQNTAQRLGERIRTARKAQKRSLVDLERTCRVHRQTLARLERGDPGVSLGVFLSVLEALRELSSVELIICQPGTPVHLRSGDNTPLERDF